MTRRFVVLDRDGTIIQQHHHLTDVQKVELVPGAAQGLQELVQLGLGLVVITNQSVVGRGMLDLEGLELIHRRLRDLLKAESVHLDGIYFCPHSPLDDCFCRKPKTGLLESAAKELAFDPSTCFVIGDQASDIVVPGRNNSVTAIRRSLGQ